MLKYVEWLGDGIKLLPFNLLNVKLNLSVNKLGANVENAKWLREAM